MKTINDVLVTMPRRAERKPDDYLVKSFVHVGSVYSLFSCEDNQIIYGRRGTGKTHLLRYLKNEVKSSGVMCIEIDMRVMGSTGGIYSDSQFSLNERAVRLLSDTLCEIRECILDQAYDSEDCDLSLLVPLLDEFVEGATNVVVEGGDFEQEATQQRTSKDTHGSDIGLKLSANSHISASLRDTNEVGTVEGVKSKETGKRALRIHFGTLSRTLRRIISLLPQKRLYLLVDEWSEVPQELQPYLADMLRRIIFSVPSITVKIAAIAHRSNFRMCTDGVEYIGLEVASDASTSINLDQFMVFDNDNEKSINFFKNLIYKHAVAADKHSLISQNVDEFISEIFTSKLVLNEFARASEGVPRDAIHIISNAALANDGKKIGVKTIRNAARQWYTTSKSKDINSKKQAVQLLEWIINVIIGAKKTRGFLVRSDIVDPLIDFLYDARVIHLLKQGASVKSIQGKKYNLYALDYGCYAHLINSKDEPRGLLYDDDYYIEVPNVDNSYTRTSILDLDDYNKTGLLPLINSTDEIELPIQFVSREDDVLNFDDPIFDSIPKYIGGVKIKGTVFIPLIFVGLVIRTRLGYKWNTGSEITSSINSYLIKDRSNAKAPNNVSRALRSDSFIQEEWLERKETNNGQVFALASKWQDVWQDYFKTQPPLLRIDDLLIDI